MDAPFPYKLLFLHLGAGEKSSPQETKPKGSIRNDITALALYGHGSERILFFSMGHGKVIHFPIIIWF